MKLCRLPYMVILFVFITVTTQAQVLEATVLEAGTNLPMPYANVYLEGTTIGTATDENGHFRIEVQKMIYTNLVVQFVGYKSTIISNPFVSLPKTIYLHEDENLINEVLISAKERYSRAQKMRIFKRYFLGDTDAGRSCKIVNEDDIHLVFSSEEKTLRAMSSVPLVIENNFLLYRVRWEIVDFHIRFARNDMASRYIEKVANIGFSYYEDKNTRSGKITKRRKDLFNTSPARLFRSISGGVAEQSGMTLMIGGFPFPPEQWFEIVPDTVNLSVKQLVMNPLEQDSEGVAIMDVDQLLPSNRLKPKNTSRIIFSADTFNIDTYGNIHPLDKLMFGGYWGNRGIGNLLPLDFLPE